VRDLLENVRRWARVSRAKVALGIGWEREGYVKNALSSALQAMKRGFGEVILVSGKGFVKAPQGLELIEDDKPWITLINLLKDDEVDAAVRGSLPASKMLKAVKQIYGLEKLHRIALLETAEGYAFFFAPVGIDEGNTIKDKLILIKHGVKLHHFLRLKPRIAVLSGGRLEDLGRDNRVDSTLCQGEFLATMVKRSRLAIDAKHYGILIEDAITDGASFILAPDGISGNLIFRTLEFLGGGRGIAAIYTDILPAVLLDSSRAMKDFTDAIALASALVGMIRNKQGAN